MVKKPLRVVIDTNILISALIYGGKPEQIYNLILEKKLTSITSLILIAELIEILTKRFGFEQKRIKQLEGIIQKHFLVVQPKKTLNIVRDKDDNRVLEVAVEGNCQFIVTGDKDLLILGSFKDIEIITAEQFLKIIEDLVHN